MRLWRERLRLWLRPEPTREFKMIRRCCDQALQCLVAGDERMARTWLDVALRVRTVSPTDGLSDE